MSLHIEARRWFQRSAGNTYHTVKIWRGDREPVTLGMMYGYGEQWLQSALDWLAEQGEAQAGKYGTLYLREELGGTYSVTDVSRRRDLHA